ncbi:MAG: ABC transporter ATP-binding protein [Candidatus Aminicenantes bacterium]|nr:ABC transporter ATP-binding protein [Candidatus Aminicenantes bacterium]
MVGKLKNKKTPDQDCSLSRKTKQKFFGGSRGAVFQKSPPGRRRQEGAPQSKENLISGHKYDWRLFKRLLPYLENYKFLIVISLVLMLAAGFFNVLTPYFIKIGIDKNIAGSDYEGLKRTAALLFILMVCALIFQVIFNYAIRYLGQRLLFDIRLDLFRHLVYLSNDYFDKTAVGRSLTFVTSDVEAIRDFISEGVLTVLSELLKISFILIAMLLINYKLALLTFLTLPLFVGATMAFRKSIRAGFRGVRKANAQINTALVESITGIREIIQFNYKEKAKYSFATSNCFYLDAFLKVVHAYALYFPVLEVVSNSGMLIILFFAHKTIGISIQVGEIFAFFFYINMFFRPLRHLAERFNMFQAAMAAAERIFKFRDRKPTIADARSPQKLDENFTGRIVFDRVTFSYAESNPVLKDLSFTIEPGERVALVGYTGSGKTTIINLLNRLYDVDSGTIRLDDAEVGSIDLRDLRSGISTISQDPFIFTGTVADNISMFDPAISREDVIQAAEQVYAHRFIEKLPQRYDENVLEEGKRLSAGQKQLLSFTRAVARRSKIVILDEATSNIDSETEKLIEAATANLLRNRTAIIIAHRLSTIRMVDRILVLHKGKLVEQGNHRQLLRKGGIYSKLYKTQAFLQN